MIGVVLAGGRGRRLAQDKAAISLAGGAMIERPLDALAEVCERVVVVCKAATVLPELPAGVQRWNEPDRPQHPVAGIVHALERADGPVLVCATDMPFVDAAVLLALVAAAGAHPDAPAVVAEAGARLQPVLGLYRPAALDGLAGGAVDAPLTRLVEALDPVRVDVSSAAVRGVNTPDELAAAEAELGSAAQQQRH